MFGWLKKFWGDGRNIGEWITSRLRVPVEWHRSLLDIRIGFKRNGCWMCLFQMGGPVEQNFWNGILTFQLYIIKTTILKIPLIIPRVGLVSRFARNWWFEAGIGYLFDRGEFGGKLTIMNWEAEEKYNPGVNARGWEEGAV
jgi:hypothetical protein